MINQGCKIEGDVKHSVIFGEEDAVLSDGAEIKKNALPTDSKRTENVLKFSVLFS